MGLNSAGLGFTFSAKDSGVGSFFTGLKSSVQSAGEQLGDFSARATASTQGLNSAGSGLKGVNDQLVVFDQAAYNASMASGAFTDTLSPERIDPGRDSLGRFTKHLFAFSKTSDTAGKSFEKASDKIDDGAKENSRHLELLASMAHKLGGVLGQLKVGNLMSAFSMKGLGGAGDALKTLTSEGGQLTTSFEANAASLAKSSRSMGVNMGLSGKELSKFQGQMASLVTGSEVPAEIAGKALAAWRTNAQDFQAIGYKSAKSLAYFSEYSGVAVDQLGDVLRKTRKTFNFADEDMKGLAGSIAAFGKQTGDAGQAWNMLPGLIEQLGTVTDSTGKKLKGAELAKFGQETISVAAGLQQTGYSAEEAMKSAQALAGAMIKGRKDFSGLFTGVNEEFPKFLTGLSISTGSTQEAFSLMNQGPEGFMKGMAKLASEVKAKGGDVNQMTAMMRDHMVEALGDEAGNAMVDFFSQADEATLQVMASTKLATVDLEKMANESHSSSRTLAESFQMAEDQFITSFRNIGRKEAVQFVADTTKQFSIFTEKMNKVAAGDGPMAGIVKQFSLMHQIGAKALLPETLRPIAALMGTMGKEIVPLIGILGSLGFRLGMLVSPLALLAVPVAILGIRFADLMMKGNSVGQAFEQIGKDIVGFLGKIPGFVNKVINSLFELTSKMFESSKNLDFTAFFAKIFGGLKGAGKGLGPTLAAFAHDVINGIGDVLSGKDPKTQSKLAGIIVNLIGAISNTFKALVKGMDASGLGAGIVDFLKNGFLFALQAPNKILGAIDWHLVVSTIFDLIGKGFTALSDKRVGGFLAMIGDAIAERVNILGGILLEFVGGALDFLAKADLSGWVTGLLHNILQLAGSLVSGVIDLIGQIMAKIPEWVPKIYETVEKLLKELPPKLGAFLDEAGTMIGPMLTKLLTSLITGIGELIKKIPSVIGMLMDAMPSILDGIGKLLQGVISFVEKVIMGALDGIMNGLTNLFPQYAEEIKAAFGFIKSFFITIFDNLKGVYNVFITVLKAGWYVLRTVVEFVFGAIWNTIKDTWDAIVIAFTFVKDAVVAGWKTLSENVSAVILEIQTAWDTFAGAVTTVWNTIWGTITGVFTSIQETASGVIQWLGDGWNTVVTFIGGLWTSFSTWFSNLWPGAAKVVGEVWSWISSTIGKVWSGIKEAGQSVGKAMSSVWESMMSGIKVVYDFIIDAVNEMKKALASLPGAEDAILLEHMDVSPAQTTLDEFADDANSVEIKPFVLSTETPAAPEGFGTREFELPKAPTVTAPKLGASTFTTGASASQMGPVPGVPPAHWEQDSAAAISSYTAVVNAASTMRTSLSTTYSGISTDSALAFKTANTAIDKLMSEGLVGTFKKTWKTILTAMPVEFFKPYNDAWKVWVDGMVDVLSKGLLRMLDNMTDAKNGMKTDAASVAADVNKMTAALQTLLNARAKAADEQKAATTEDLNANITEADRAHFSAEMLELIKFTNDPMWATAYRAEFGQKMDALIAAVNNSNQRAETSTGGSSADARKKIVARNGGATANTNPK